MDGTVGAGEPGDAPGAATTPRAFADAAGSSEPSAPAMAPAEIVPPDVAPAPGPAGDAGAQLPGSPSPSPEPPLEASTIPVDVGGGGGGGAAGDEVDVDAVLESAPATFFCPISTEIMRDPVLLMTGQVRAPAAPADGDTEGPPARGGPSRGET